jgi:hypothetical protein
MEDINYTNIVDDPFKCEQEIDSSSPLWENKFDISDFSRSYLIRDIKLFTSALLLQPTLKHIRFIYYTNKEYQHFTSLCYILHSYLKENILFKFDIVCYTNKNISIEPSFAKYVSLQTVYAISEHTVLNNCVPDTSADQNESCTIFIYDFNSMEDVNIFEVNDALVNSRIELNNRNKVNMLINLDKEYSTRGDIGELISVFNLEFINGSDDIDFYGEFINFPWVDSSDNEIFFKVVMSQLKINTTRNIDNSIIIPKRDGIYQKWKLLHRILRHTIPKHTQYVTSDILSITSAEYASSLYYDKILEIYILRDFQNVMLKLMNGEQMKNISQLLKIVESQTDFFPNMYTPNVPRDVDEERKLSKLYVHNTNELMFSVESLNDVIVSNNAVYVSQKSPYIQYILTNSDLTHFIKCLADTKYNTYRHIISLGDLQTSKKEREYVVYYKLSYLIHKMLYIVNKNNMVVQGTPKSRKSTVTPTSPTREREITIDYANNINRYIDLQIAVMHKAIKNHIKKTLDTSENKYVQPVDIFKAIKYSFNMLTFDTLGGMIYKATHINQMNKHIDLVSSRITNVHPTMVGTTINNMFVTIQNTDNGVFSRFKYIMRLVYICIYPLLKTVETSISDGKFSFIVPKRDISEQSSEQTPMPIEFTHESDDIYEIFNNPEHYGTFVIMDNVNFNIVNEYRSKQLEEINIDDYPHFIWLSIDEIDEIMVNEEQSGAYELIIEQSTVYNHINELINQRTLFDQLLEHPKTSELILPTLTSVKKSLIPPQPLVRNILFKLDEQPHVYEFYTIGRQKSEIVCTNDINMNDDTIENTIDINTTVNDVRLGDDDFRVVQQTVARPLLLDRKMFNVKTFVCVIKTIDKVEILYYTKPYAIKTLGLYRKKTDSAFGNDTGYMFDEEMKHSSNMFKLDAIGTMLSANSMYTYLFGEPDQYNDYFKTTLKVLITRVFSRWFEIMYEEENVNVNTNTTFEIIQLDIVFDELLNPWVRNITNDIDYNYVPIYVKDELLKYLFEYIETGSLNRVYEKLMFENIDNIEKIVMFDSIYTVIDNRFMYVKTSNIDFANCVQIKGGEQQIEEHIDIQDEEETQEQMSQDRYFSVLDYIIQQKIPIDESSDSFVSSQVHLFQQQIPPIETILKHVSNKELTLDNVKAIFG